MARYTKKSLLSKYRSDNPDIKLNDERLFYEIMKANPGLKNSVSDYKKEIGSSLVDYIPNVIKEGYNRSLTGMADELISGKKRFDMRKYNPGVLEDIASSAISLMMPADIAGLGGVGKIGGSVGKMLANSFFKNGVGKSVSHKVVKSALSKSASGAASFSTYSGLGSALGQQIDTGNINIDEVTEEALKGGIAGAISGGIGGILTSTGASSLTKVAAETGALGTTGAILEDRMPTPQDYFNTAGVILGLKGGSKIFSNAKNIRKLFQEDPKVETYKPTESQARELSTGTVKDRMRSALTREEWISPGLQKNNKPFSKVRITNSSNKSYTIEDLNTNKYTNISKNKFHTNFKKTDKDLGTGSIRDNLEKEVLKINILGVRLIRKVHYLNYMKQRVENYININKG